MGKFDVILNAYMQWNRRTARHFLYGRQAGSPIFLSFDAEAAELIAAELNAATVEGDEQLSKDPTEQFLEVVRGVCVFNGHVPLNQLPQDEETDIPGGVAFLAAMVLAAHRMRDDDQGAEAAYFLRLAELLHTPGDRAGIPTGAEEPLWLQWNGFLRARGYLTTAESGSGPTRFLQYVRSQAVLRDSDKEAIRKEFARRSVPDGLDVEQLGFWLRQETWTRRYLREGFAHPDPHRRAEFYRSAYDVYQTRVLVSSEDAAGEAHVARQRQGRTIEAGLYRETDLRGRPTYWLLPRQPERFEPRSMHVSLPGAAAPIRLRTLRPGFYRPLAPQSPFVEAPLQFPVTGDPRLTTMLFPQRDFWILTEDPEDPSGPYASWSRYLEVGQRFTLLCKPGALVAEMRRLRNWRDLNQQPLVNWTKDEQVAADVHEFFGCMVLSYELGAVTASPESQKLLDSLAPRAAVSVALAGGLRDSQESAWLEGFPPVVVTYGFAGAIDLAVSSAAGDNGVTIQCQVKSQEPYPLPSSLPAGIYLATATSEGISARRLFRVIKWEDMRHPSNVLRVWNQDPMMTASVAICGAKLKETTDSSGGEEQ